MTPTATSDIRTIKPTKQDLLELAEYKQEGAPLLTLLCPLDTRPGERDANAIRVRNFTRHADEILQDAGLSSADRQSHLAPLELLERSAANPDRAEKGLAVFLAPNTAYQCPLPYRVPSCMLSGETFALRYLIPAAENGSECLLLALSQGDTRLFTVHSDTLEQRSLPQSANNLEAFTTGVEEEKSLQFHTGAGTTGTGGERPAVFHGHGAPDNLQAARLREFLTEVDKAVNRLANGQPVILAGDEHILAEFRDLSQLGNIIQDAIVGNPDHMHEPQLLEAVLPLRTRLARNARRRHLDRFTSHRGSGRSTTDAEKLRTAAERGQIDTLIAPAADSPREPDERCIANTLRTSGHVIVVSEAEMPDNANLAGVLRKGTLASGLA